MLTLSCNAGKALRPSLALLLIFDWDRIMFDFYLGLPHTLLIRVCGVHWLPAPACPSVSQVYCFHRTLSAPRTLKRSTVTMPPQGGSLWRYRALPSWRVSCNSPLDHTLLPHTHTHTSITLNAYRHSPSYLHLPFFCNLENRWLKFSIEGYVLPNNLKPIIAFFGNNEINRNSHFGDFWRQNFAKMARFL